MKIPSTLDQKGNVVQTDFILFFYSSLQCVESYLQSSKHPTDFKSPRLHIDESPKHNTLA